MSWGRGVRKKASRQQLPNVEAFDPKIIAEVRALFGKVKAYVKPGNEEWCIPDPNEVLKHPAQEHIRLQTLKKSLNKVKNRLSDKDLEVWHQHTNSTNRAGKVIATVRAIADAEICTQAWCKFYEILGTFNLLPKDALRSGELNTVHLCEAPGAFIAALNHYLKTSEHTRYCDWSWVANTLNPYHEASGGGTAITDDRLISSTLPWWFFGSDDTGDLMSQKHLLELHRFVGNMRRVDVVTADGSFDCQGNPDEQEALVASLHYCEAVAALVLLGPGGSLVLKMFTLYEHSSVCLLYLLNCCFRSVSVFKPATSKAGNSEVYVVCLHYDDKEAARPLLSKLLRHYGPDLAAREALFPSQLLPQSFLEQHEQVCVYFHALQVDTIEENLRLFEGLSEEQRKRLECLRDCTAQEYLQRFQVRFLPRSHWLSCNSVTPACCSVKVGKPPGQSKQTGSFNQRRELLALGWRERVGKGCYAAWVEEHCSKDSGAGWVLPGPLAGCDINSWFVVVGAALSAVRNSSFCDGGLLNHLNEALEQTALESGTDSSAAWTGAPSCSSCSLVCTASILTEVAALCTGEGDRKCLVFGRTLWCGERVEGLTLEFCSETLFQPPVRTPLHDGEPQYQRNLVHCVLDSLNRMGPGDALLLPLLSAFTRVTAAIVLCLHLSFRSVTFRVPAPQGVLLMCVGFCPEAATRILAPLGDLQERMDCLNSGEEGSGSQPPAGKRQILQFVPMEELLKEGLIKFLWTMNSTIARQQLHLLMQA
ncbi:cap-specific mRNA (nucleoside-2'-O-)-methyltransferase 2 [Esox lucius]|uniref:Cap-specific mRNA (nucleoside-2'-O-)-methyltransferase 2 n=1 Tax=Esox lucius TaxID=8010 RepID=A0A3P8Y5A6_ESOLU|nr:cap-specific mRNA (nucleoside-2'-O-)-methyltransferase 2 [Esox lucius]XP_019896046.2 cap-specific mRNA (nucleoside-2'-O-)-methyltransferase 2 [Esox lucius]XP_019896047.2 cap-specific mRNA (nucleoside-2'-O-)-methyltransferase 2 [Esox lucius]XP_034143659.1 cap-specific mRNA (nucleoside-2'-O-)-methyltransferase 2 [Esox lucius]